MTTTDTDPQATRQARRDALRDLITRIGHGRAGADIGTLLALAVDAEMADADQAHARLADYENRLTWETNCGEHARLLDSCRAAEERAEQAEAANARVRGQVEEWRTWSGTEPAIRDMQRALGDIPAPQPQDPATLDGDQPAEPECRQPQGCDKVIPCAPGCAITSRALTDAMAKVGVQLPAETGHIAPEPVPCDTYQPPTSPEESGLCAACGMSDWKHQPAGPDGAALWAAIRDHAACDYPFWDRLDRVRGRIHGRTVTR